MPQRGGRRQPASPSAREPTSRPRRPRPAARSEPPCTRQRCSSRRPALPSRASARRPRRRTLVGRQYSCRALRRRVGRIAIVAFSFLYVAFRALLGAVVRCRRGLDAKDLELLVLRDELAVLRRPGAPP